MPILSANKRKAPILNINWEKPVTKEPVVEVTEEKKETTSKEPENDTNQSSKILIDSTKEITKNSIKVIANFTSSPRILLLFGL